jgi:polysaccharide biosynthesis/export protein ExoF
MSAGHRKLSEYFLSNSSQRLIACSLLLFTINTPFDVKALADNLTDGSVLDAPASNASRKSARSNLNIHVGDQIKLSFYELLDSEEGKWRGPNGRAPTGPIGFHERGELSGIYTVQEDGSISLPLLGSFAVDGDTTVALIDKLTKPFNELVGRKGFVNVLSIEHQPIYVVGPVKNPGSFKYQPNLTALHAVALAGGLRQSDGDAWQNVEARREVATLEKSLEKVKRLVARTTVLKAERDGSTPAISQVVSLAGPSDANLLIDQETTRRRLTETGRAVQSTALKIAVNNARSELDARTGRLVPYDDNIKLRMERIKGLEQLADKNLITRTPLVQAQSELSDVQDRKQQAMIDIDTTKQRLILAEQDLAKHNIETRLEIEDAIAAAERDSSDAIVDTQGSLKVIRSLASQRGVTDGEGGLVYEIVRHTKQGTELLNVAETTLLEPGDLLRIRSNDAEDGR